MQVPRPRSTPLPIYDDERCALIAKAIRDDFDVSRVIEHRFKFELASHWYEINRVSPKGVVPSAGRKKLNQIAGAARRLLKHLEIRDPTDAPDGPGNIDIIDALASVDNQSVESITDATSRIGLFVKALDAAEAAKRLERTAKAAAKDIEDLGELTVSKEHQGNTAVNRWIGDMLETYRDITGKEPATSVGGPGHSNEGLAGGPLIRFLQAAAIPLDIEYDEDAWRSRVRTILRNTP